MLVVVVLPLKHGVVLVAAGKAVGERQAEG